MPIDVAEVRAQIEQDFSWRWNEMKLLKNQLGTMGVVEDRDRFRKALVVMLYAHYEGFCKTALTIYVGAINSANLRCGEVKGCIAASSLAQVFKEYDNPTKKSELFKATLPDDSKLHRFARQADFMEHIREVWNKQVEIPEDVVDTESNLNPAVLSKILYRLGFEHDIFHEQYSDINQLLRRRNDIAHGSAKSGLDEQVYDKIEKVALNVSTSLIRLIYRNLVQNTYMK